MKKTIAFDFDGVIHKYSKGWQDGKIYDVPVKGALEGLVELYNKDYEIIIFTTREEDGSINRWIAKQYHKYFPNQEIFAFRVTNKKPPAIAYIGKWIFRFTGDWNEILEEPISEKEEKLRKKYEGILPKITDGELGYIGGFIDSDGCITSGKNSDNRLYIRLMITNQHIETLEWVKMRFGGSIYTRKIKNGQRFPVSIWHKYGISLKPLFEALIKKNLIKNKKQQVILAIEYFKMQRFNGRKKSEFQYMQQEQIIEAIKQLNQWGMAEIQPIVIDDRGIRFTNWKDILNYF